MIRRQHHLKVYPATGPRKNAVHENVINGVPAVAVMVKAWVRISGL